MLSAFPLDVGQPQPGDQRFGHALDVEEPQRRRVVPQPGGRLRGPIITAASWRGSAGRTSSGCGMKTRRTSKIATRSAKRKLLRAVFSRLGSSVRRRWPRSAVSGSSTVTYCRGGVSPPKPAESTGEATSPLLSLASSRTSIIEYVITSSSPAPSRMSRTFSSILQRHVSTLRRQFVGQQRRRQPVVAVDAPIFGEVGGDGDVLAVAWNRDE